MGLGVDGESNSGEECGEEEVEEAGCCCRAGCSRS